MDSILDRGAQDALRQLDIAPLKGARVMLTGATGLIGANLAAALARTGCALTRYKRGGPIMGSYDYIIHAAGYAQPARFMADPLGTIRVNTTMLLDLLDKLAPKGRLLYLSTSEIYSGNSRALHNENDIGTTNPAHARSSYIESKRCGEAICHAARQAGQAALIARVSSVYGPGARPRDARVVSQLIDQAISDREVVLKDGGTARRVFLYTSDAVEMLLNVLVHGEQIVYNVGGPAMNVGGSGSNLNGEISIVTLARRIGDYMKVPVKVPSDSVRGGGLSGVVRTSDVRSRGGIDGAPMHVGVDIGRYVREFPKETFVQIDEGLKRTIEWHRAMAEKGLVAA